MKTLLVLVLTLVCGGSVFAEETIVFSGYPITKVESNADSTAQHELTDEQSSDYRVLIMKRNGKYYWASRENKELMHFRSGIAHWFISESSGYIKIIDPSLIPGNDGTEQFVYMEHPTLVIDTITYWGVGNALSP